MNDEQQGSQDTRPLRPGGDDIPRRGYERRRDTTGSLRPPQSTRPTSSPDEPIAYDPPPRRGPRPGTPPPPRRGPGGQRAPRDSGCYLPWWSLVILILFVGATSLGLLAVVANLSGGIILEPTPQIIIVTGVLEPTPLGTQAGPPTPIATFQVTPTNPLGTVLPTRTPLPGGCLLNEEVIVFGTGGVGLNLRDRPGGEVLFIAKEGEKMLVIDGPQFFDSVQWCQVRSLSQGSSFGWAALDFLIAADAIENPE